MRDRSYFGAAALCFAWFVGCQSAPDAEVRERADPREPRSTSEDEQAVDTRKLRDAGARRDGSTGVSKQRDARADDAAVSAAPDDGGERPAFCARPDDDLVRTVFCTGSAPKIGSLRELQDLVRVNARPLARGTEITPEQRADPYSVVSVAVFLAHSTALSGKLVSAINPRAIILGQRTMLTFQRGVQQVELVSLSRSRGVFNFYLLSFRQACNERPEGCLPGDLYTPQIEADWRSFEIHDDEELKNTPSDCRQCHQRGLEAPVLLMRELESPWTHFFESDPEIQTENPPPGVRGRHLVGDYLQAKGDETYAEVPLTTLRSTIPLVLENRMSLPQPLVFDSRTIDDERWLGPDGVLSQPRRSATWDAAYEAFKRGEQLALPYFEPRVTDPAKLARLSEAYRRYQSGELPAEELPDLADIFSDDPQVRAELGLQTEPGASPAQLLVQACGACHNDVLDQTISRARFNIDLARMDRAELDLAIERLALSKHALGAMPPPEARELDAQARTRLSDYLRSDERSAEDAALLARAAKLGMAGP